MPENADIQQARIDARQAFRSGDYAAARRLFRVIREEAPSDSPEWEQAELYLRHLGDSDNDPAFDLLRQIQQPQEATALLNLVQQAIAQGLQFDLDERNLADRLDDLKKDQEYAADQRAQGLLAQAGREPDLQKAIAICQDALAIKWLGAPMLSEAQKLGRLLECWAEAANLRSQAHHLLEQPEMTEEAYANAEQLAQQAQKLAKEDDPNLAKWLQEDATASLREDIARLVEETEQQRKTLQSLQQMLKEATDNLAKSPASSKASYASAKSEAERLKLSVLASEAEQGLRLAEEAFQANLAKAQELVKKGKTAQEQGDLPRAQELFQQAFDLAGAATNAEQWLGQVNRIIDAQTRIRELRQQADDEQKGHNYARAIARLEEARSLAQEADPTLLPELEAPIKQLQDQQSEAQEILTTIKLQSLPYATPQEFMEQRGKLESEIPREGLEAMDQLFRGQSAGKLRLYLDQAWKSVEVGDLNAACGVMEEAQKQWDDYLKIERTKTGDIPALHNRLQILRTQLEDVRAARDAYKRLKSIAPADRALQKDNYKDALAGYREALHEFGALDESARYILGDRRDRPGDGAIVGVLRRVRHDFAAAARRYARQQEESLAQWRDQAQAALRLGTPKSLQEAQKIVARALPLAKSLRDYKEKHDEFVSEGQRASWTSPDWVEPFETLSGKVEQALKLHYWLDLGEQKLNQGDHVGAEVAFKEAQNIDTVSVTAASGLERVRQFKTLRGQLELAESESDIAEQDRLVRAILDLLPLSSWAVVYKQEHDLDSKIKARAQIQRNLDNAQKLVNRGKFDQARPLVESVLAQLPDDAQAIRLKQAIDEGEEGTQRLRALRQQAKEAFGRGDFSEAALRAEEVLHDRRDDSEMKDLAERAERARDLEEQVAIFVASKAYDKAKNLLRQISDMEGVESASARHQRWLIEIDEQLAEKADLDELMEQMCQARKDGDWAEAAKFAYQVLSLKKGYVDAISVAAEAKRQLLSHVRAAIQSRKPEQLVEATPKLKVLEQYYSSDTTIPLLRKDLDRIRRLAAAQRTLAQPILGDDPLNNLVQELEQLCKDWDDPQAQATFNEASYRHLIRRAEQLERAADLPRAIQALTNALGIDLEREAEGKTKPKTELEKDRQRLRLQLAQAESDRLLLQGELNKAKDALLGFEAIPTAQERIARITRFDETMRTVRGLLAKGHDFIKDALKKLDELGGELADFEPAKKTRQNAINDLLARAQAAEKSNLWEAQQLYELFEDIAPGETSRSNLSQVKSKLNQEIQDLSGKIRNAIEEKDQLANLTEKQCQDLREEIMRVYKIEKNFNATIRNARDALQDYEQRIKQMSPHLIKAEGLLIEAYRNKNKYAEADTAIHAACAGDLAIFATRDELRRLRTRHEDQKELHDKIERRAQEYRDSLEKARQVIPSLNSNDPTRVQAVLTEAQDLVAQALKASDEIMEWDPDDLYGQRKWSDKNKPDPWKEERKQLVACKDSVTTIGQALLDGLADWRDAQQSKTLAEQASQPPLTDDERYKQAIRCWENTAALCQQALGKLSPAFSTASLLPRADALKKDAEGVQKKIKDLSAHSQEMAGHFRGELDKLILVENGEPIGAYAAAQKAENPLDPANSPKTCAQWRMVLGSYAAVLEINPDYELAKKGRERCQKQVDALCRPTPWWVYALGALGVVMVGFLAWFFGLGPGAAPAPTTPTITPTRMIISPTSSPLPIILTSTPSPTAGPSRTPAPTQTPRPTQPPRVCHIFDAGSAWARREPNTSTTGELLKRSTELIVIDFIDQPDGKWYKIEKPLNGWWVRAIEVTCPDNP